MTNLESFNKALITQDDGFATIILESKGIDPEGTDDNQQSFAWGLISSVMAPDYAQGKTSEKLTAKAAAARVSLGKKMLLQLGIEYNEGSQSEITSVSW